MNPPLWRLCVKFEYMVCMVQEDRVTWVDGAWAGQSNPTADVDKGLSSCPSVSEFLEQKQSDGWRLMDTVEFGSARLKDVKSLHLMRTLTAFES